MAQKYAPPTVVYPQQDDSGVWLGGGLCGCCSDGDICITTCCFPCYTYAKNKKLLYGVGDQHDIFDSESLKNMALYILVAIASCDACTWIMGVEPRQELRKKYGLPLGSCGDCCTHCCCHCCALCQEARELKSRPVTQWPLVNFQQQDELTVSGYPVPKG